MTLSLFFLAAMSFAQPDDLDDDEDQTRKEKLKAHKIAFISTELDLTTEEAEKFWPVYNEMDAKMEDIHQQRRIYRKKMRGFDELPESEAYEITEKLFELDDQENAIRKEYLGKFAKVLGKKKAAKVFLAEEKFKRELLKKLKEHQGGGGGKPGGTGSRGGPHDGTEFNR